MENPKPIKLQDNLDKSIWRIEILEKKNSTFYKDLKHFSKKFKISIFISLCIV